MPFRYKKRRSKPCSGMVPLTELDYIMVSASSSRRRGTVHRTVLFNGFESFAKQKNEAFLQEYLKKTGAANRTRTGTELPQADFKCEKIAQHWGPVPAWNCPKFIWFFWKIII